MKKPDNKKSGGSQNVRCEDCLYYDYDEEYEDYVCMMSFDEDEAVRYLSSGKNRCPYFRFYDEYKSVQKQN